MYRNPEHYLDPTPGAVIRKITGIKKRSEARKETELSKGIKQLEQNINVIDTILEEIPMLLKYAEEKFPGIKPADVLDEARAAQMESFAALRRLKRCIVDIIMANE